ncbi:hypothetical protein DMX03_23505 [Pseudomonas koreensis]|nr:hypothetical protein DMX03_23505 [Pseudomonas koreensis]
MSGGFVSIGLASSRAGSLPQGNGRISNVGASLLAKAICQTPQYSPVGSRNTPTNNYRSAPSGLSRCYPPQANV